MPKQREISILAANMAIEQYFKKIIESIGEDPNREGLRDTPKRAVKALAYLTEGYRQNLDDIINDAVFTSSIDELIVIKDIELYSLCEHHLLPFIGKCHVGYIPDGKVIGISKIARIVDLYARRLQIQENLTGQIATAIEQVTNAKGVAVVIEAQHLCMMMRGVTKQNSIMSTSDMRGKMRSNEKSRLEFMHLLK